MDNYMVPFYDLVPKDFDANLKFRSEIIQLGCSDKSAAEELWIMCSRDPLFYINTFVFTYDPRRQPSALPFITYDYQDDAIMQIDKAIGNHDLMIEKSRDMGASWLCLFCFEYRFHFNPLQSFLCVSRKEDLVDKTEDPDSLFWKIDFIHKNQPGWLRPNVNRTKLHIYNNDNCSTIDGTSTTGDVARGGRRTAILLDEFASVDNGHAVLRSTRDATTCRLFNSTPKGTGNAFYDMKQTDVAKLNLHWSKHPIKAAGLYTAENGELRIIDTNYKFANDYPFILDSKYRSPWYDEQVKRAAHNMEIAQELDIDYLGSDYQFFDSYVLDSIQRAQVRQPYLVGDLDFDNDTLIANGFIERDKGPFLLWANVDAQGNLPEDRDYVLGVDIATGTGASNSCISVGDCKTKEKIGEYVVNKLKPHELAKVAVAMARWLKGPSHTAKLIWEVNGPGREFGDTVIELGYKNIYYKVNENSFPKKQSNIPGWFSTKQTKLALLGEYRKALADNDFINHSYYAISEAREYVFTTTGSVAHAKSIDTADPARDNHGDRVIADALCSKGMKEFITLIPKRKSIPKNCFYTRKMEALRREKQEASW